MNSEGGEKPWQEIEVEKGRKIAKKKKEKHRNPRKYRSDSNRGMHL